MTDSVQHQTDLQDIDKLITRFFAVFDNRAEKKPVFSVLDQVFIDGGMIYKRDASSIESMDLKSFKTPREALFASGVLRDFYEWEIHHQTTVNMGLASRVSTYQKAGFLNDESYQGHGVKHFQLIKTDMGWKIVSITWEDFV